MAKPKRWKRLKKLGQTLDWRELVQTLGPCPKFRNGMSIDEQKATSKLRVRWQQQLVELIATHRRRSRMSDVEEQQETHSPTVEISVDDPEATRRVRRNITRVRQSEAWRHNKLSGMQRDAEREMEFAWRQRTAGLGAAVSKYGLHRGGSTARTDLGSSIDQSWCEWASMCPGRRIMIAAVIDCLAEPKTLPHVEREHRMRRGQAIENYITALDLWCEVRGWIRGPRMDRGPHLMPEGATS